MKPDLHPEWYPEAQVLCACGTTWTVGATVPEIRTDVCASCHPFFTGEQRIVDTEGQVDRFMRRLRARDEALREEELRRAARTSPELPLKRLGLGRSLERTLEASELEKAGDVLAILEEEGDTGLTERGLGLKELADLKRALRTQGFVLPGDEPPAEEEPEEPEEQEGE